VDEILARIGKHIVLAIPVGLGKPNQLVNALFNRALADRSIELRILTALTLERPTGAKELERAFLAPLIARVYGDYPDLEYARALRNDALPPNIKRSLSFSSRLGLTSRSRRRSRTTSAATTPMPRAISSSRGSTSSRRWSAKPSSMARSATV
jgi:hypothetical protein